MGINLDFWSFGTNKDLRHGFEQKQRPTFIFKNTGNVSDTKVPLFKPITGKSLIWAEKHKAKLVSWSIFQIIYSLVPSLPPHPFPQEISCPDWPICLGFSLFKILGFEIGLFWSFGFCPRWTDWKPSKWFLKLGPSSKVKVGQAKIELLGQFESFNCTVGVASVSFVNNLSSFSNFGF